MANSQLIPRLLEFLEVQIHSFDQMESLQDKLDNALSGSQPLDKILQLLDTKAKLVDELSSRTVAARPLVATWVEMRQELQGNADYSRVEKCLDAVEIRVKALRLREEKLIAGFSKYVEAPPTPEERQRRSKQILDAWRALR